MRRSGSVVRWLSAWGCFLAGVIEAYPGATAADPPASESNSQQLIQEVTVTAHKLIDERTLDRVIIPRFVESHGMPNPRSNQVGRWTPYLPVCPSTMGLKPAFADYVSRRVLAVAAMVGAPAAPYGRCKFTVEIIFTPSPQAQVSYLAKTYRALLGHDQGSLKQRLTFTHEIQAWYTTATHTVGGARCLGGWSVDSDVPLCNEQAQGSASRLSNSMLSGIVNVLIIVDSKQVDGHSLGSIADYIALLALTRTSVDGCSELASIVDLLSADCAGRAPPDSVTPADIAYLKALYSADLQMNMNIERGDLHDRMSREVLGR
jgi:hypothetical protein